MRLNSQNPWGNAPILQQAREAVKETRELMKEIEQGTFKPNHSKQSDTASNNAASPMSPAQMQAQMRVMMQTLQNLTQQMSGSLNQFNQQYPNNALTLDAVLPWLFFQSLFNPPPPAGSTPNGSPSKDEAPDSSSNSPAKPKIPASKAEAMVQDLLKTTPTEKTNATKNNIDEDDFTVSQEDINKLKASLEAKEFTANDLAVGLQKTFIKGTSENQDELAILFSKLMDQGVVSANQTLNPVFLTQLDAERQTMLVEALANAGVTLDSGKPNRATAGWILSNLDSPHEKQKKFAQTLADRMAEVWKDEFDTAEGKQVKAFLTDWTEVLADKAADVVKPETTASTKTSDSTETAPEKATDETEENDATVCNEDKAKKVNDKVNDKDLSNQSKSVSEESSSEAEAVSDEDKNDPEVGTESKDAADCDPDTDKSLTDKDKVPV